MTDRSFKEQDGAEGSPRGTAVPPRTGSDAPHLRGERSEDFCQAKASLGTEALKSLGPLELAYVGDAVFELLVRTRLARHGARVGELHRAAVAYVSAPAQAAAVERLLPLLTDEELRVYHRGRNAHVHGCPAGCTVSQYHAATALEALFGYLWLSGERERAGALFEALAEGRDAT